MQAYIHCRYLSSSRKDCCSNFSNSFDVFSEDDSFDEIIFKKLLFCFAFLNISPTTLTKLVFVPPLRTINKGE